MYLYRCIVIFLQVDYSLLKPQKRFELNWFNVAITTTGRLGFLLFLETCGKCKYFHSQIVPLGEGLLHRRISSITIYLRLESDATFSSYDDMHMMIWRYWCIDMYDLIWPDVSKWYFMTWYLRLEDVQTFAEKWWDGFLDIWLDDMHLMRWIWWYHNTDVYIHACMHRVNICVHKHYTC